MVIRFLLNSFMEAVSINRDSLSYLQPGATLKATAHKSIEYD